MMPVGPVAAGVAFVCFAVTWAWYFRIDIARWWRERGPRRKLARELARERESEVIRLRDELAEKYLAGGAAKPPSPGG